MAERVDLQLYTVKPQHIFLTLLATSFVTEFTIMHLLPWMLPKDSSRTLYAAADAILLTLVVAPILWFAVVRPIEKLSSSRFAFMRRSLIVQESERRRIKHELHDGIGQSLTSLLLGLRAIEESTHEHKVLEIVRSLRPIGTAIHDDLRRIVGGLHPAVLDRMGLKAAVAQLIEQLELSTSIKFSLTADNLQLHRFDLNYETLVYRIVQESINNAVKHSGATRVDVDIKLQEDQLLLSVSDDGRGISSKIQHRGETAAFGLIGLRERALAIGGHIEITSGRAGTKVLATLPIWELEQGK